MNDPRAVAPGTASSAVPPAAMLFRDPGFLRLWGAGSLSGTMRWLDVLTVGVFTFERTGSPLLVSLVLFLRMFPLFLFGPALGALAERVDRRRLLLVGIAFMMLTYGVLTGLAMAGQLEVWHAALGCFIGGIFWAMELPTRRTMLMEAVGMQRIGSAMGFESSTQALTRGMGPLVGGFLLEKIGMEGAYGLGTIFLVGAFVLIVLTRTSAGVPAAGESVAAQPRVSLLRTVSEGIAYIRQDRVVQAVLFSTIALNMFGFAYVSMVPVIGKAELGLSAFPIGVIMSAEGIAAFFGCLTIAFRGSIPQFHRIFLFGSFLYLFSILLFSLSYSYWLSFAVLFAGGFGMSGYTTMQSALILAQAPAALRSRVMGVMAFCIGFAPFGVLNLGFLATLIGPRDAVTLIASLGIACFVAIAVARPEIRSRRALSP